MATQAEFVKDWKYPDWIYLAQQKISHIDLNKFPISIRIDTKVISPTQNKYCPFWAIKLEARLIGVKDRLKGTKTDLLSREHFYIYSADKIEQFIYAEIEQLIIHELQECFQVVEEENRIYLPFDPHSHTSQLVKRKVYNRIKFVPSHPSVFQQLYYHFKFWLKDQFKFFSEDVNWFSKQFRFLCQSSKQNIKQLK